MIQGLLTHGYLLENLSYCPMTGVFRWKKPRRKIKVGDIAGTPQSEGYTTITINYRRYLAHRLAWFYSHGEWPPNDVDHINRVRSDNRLENLRLATRKENMENQSLRSDNTSGYRGVGFDKARAKWTSQIRHNKQTILLGRFDDLFSAVQARKAAEQRLFTRVEASA